MAKNEALTPDLLHALLDRGVPLAIRIAQAAELRARNRDAGGAIDRMLFERLGAYEGAVRELREVNEDLEGLARKLTSPPLREALFLGAELSPNDITVARVTGDGSDRLIQLADEAVLDELQIGDRVYLTQAGNAVLGKAPDTPAPGASMTVERWVSDERLVVKDRDQEIVVRASAKLRAKPVKSGDRVRIDRSAWIAMEPIEGSDTQRYAASMQATALLPEALAGYDELRTRVLKRLTYALAHAEIAKRYGVARASARVLLEGPPGCGKTTFARVIAGALQRITGHGCSVTKVNGAELYSPFVGETEQNIKRLLRELQSAEAAWAVLFLDEVDAIARIRGAAGNVHSDRFLNTLLAEIEGFDGRARIVLVAATNRADMLDPAFRERFSWEIRVPRPRMDSARAIFARHLEADLPYRPNGDATAQTRACIIESAVSQLYDPNASAAVIATLRFRDGKSRRIEARELVSGRLIEQICQDARERAFQRAVDVGDQGITERDMESALTDAIARLRGTLTLENIHAYLQDLPTDIGVVSVEPAGRGSRPHAFLQ